MSDHARQLNDDAMRMFEAAPIHQLRQLDDESWLAEGDDPQFQLQVGDFPGAGTYQIILELEGEAIHAPCIYFDMGEGWTEACRINLWRSRDGWTALATLPAIFRPARLDPTDRSGAFFLGAITLHRLDDAEALHLLLQDDPATASISPAPAELRTRLSEGLPATIAWLLRQRRDAVQVAAPDLIYAHWAARFDQLDGAALGRLRQAAGRLPRRPLISVLLPVYDTPAKYLRECLDSVLAQVYPDWELCIADDGSPSPHVGQIIAEYAARDSRIRYVLRESNGHICAASNSALELASGQFVALLDHDDVLPAHALLAVAQAIIRHPRARLFYSDEDKIDADGRRYDPYMKPAWNPELFLSQNYFSHLGVYATALVHEVGGFRAGFEGSQDYDLALRCVATIEPGQIVHIPLVLYHWRAIEGSTALAANEKDYAADAGRRALEEHLRAMGRPAAVEPVAGGYRRRYAISASAPKISLLIPTHDRVELLRVCVDSILRKTEYPNYEIVIIDNQSIEPATAEYLQSLAAQPRVRVLRYEEPFNYSRINNFAVSQVDGELVGLINNDIEVIDGAWLHEMAAYALQPAVGAVGAMLYYPDDTIQHAGIVIGIHGLAAHPYSRQPRGSHGQMGRARLVQNLSAVTAACLLVRRDRFIEVGGLEEALQVAYNDVDFCLKLLEHGYRNVWTPFAELYHHESASRGHEDSPEKQARFQLEAAWMRSHWGHRLGLDPTYHWALSVDAAPFSLNPEPLHSLAAWAEKFTNDLSSLQ